VLAEQRQTAASACACQPQLRHAALRLGALLGWSADEVAAFAAALTGRPWPDCRAEELWRVLEEYERLAEVLVARAARPRPARRRRRNGAAGA
jgi:hypothetical protein